MMRAIAVSLALLAGAKIWTQEQIYRSATEDALVQAYRTQAITSCRSAPLSSVVGTKSSQLRQRIATAFATPSVIHLEIGNQNVSVSIWETDRAEWATRYTAPYIVLEAADPAARCTYDVKRETAQITLL